MIIFYEASGIVSFQSQQHLLGGVAWGREEQCPRLLPGDEAGSWGRGELQAWSAEGKDQNTGDGE